MSANILFLYGATVIIWGTTWLAIKFQLGGVDPMVSVLYRFIAASVILMVYCRMADLKMRFHLKDHIFMALQGLVLFSVNYRVLFKINRQDRCGSSGLCHHAVSCCRSGHFDVF
jgi:drug/metabolite transporter (DMT)-like permease